MSEVINTNNEPLPLPHSNNNNTVSSVLNAKAWGLKLFFVIIASKVIRIKKGWSNYVRLSTDVIINDAEWFPKKK